MSTPLYQLPRVSADELRDAMRLWATGVTVVSSAHNGVQHGMTVTSFTSIALTPPLLMVSLEIGTRTHGLVQLSGRFAVTVLTDRQQTISDRFAGRDTEHTNRFEELDTFTLLTGCPLLKEGLAQFDCRVVASHLAGNHTLFIGEVLATQAHPDAQSLKPLLYHDRGYRKLRD